MANSIPTPIHPDARAALALLRATAADLTPALPSGNSTSPARALIPLSGADQVTPALAAAERYMQLVRPSEIITRVNDAPYIQRWYLRRDRHGNNHYLHLIEGSDDDVPHCHPWPSVSVLLRGELIEHWQATGEPLHPIIETVPAATLVTRTAALAHRLLLPPPPAPAPITLFVTGPKERAWGFWPPHPDGTRRRFIVHTDHPGRSTIL